jgi:two-component system response regulator DevR
VTPISVLIVDDHEVVRVGLRTLLSRRRDILVLGTAASAEEAVSLALEHRPDVVVCDVRMPDRSGVEACREIRSLLPDTRILMLTSYADEDAVVASILAGASGYLLKDTTGQDLVDAVHRIADGASLLDPAVTGFVLSRLKAEDAVGADALTAREQQILELIAQGRTNREIGAVLFLAEGTVRNLVSAILAKLGAGSRAEAAARFARTTPPPREAGDGPSGRDEGP